MEGRCFIKIKIFVIKEEVIGDFYIKNVFYNTIFLVESFTISQK